MKVFPLVGGLRRNRKLPSIAVPEVSTLKKSLQIGLRAPEDQRVNIVRTFIGIDRF